jgi:hypothetical protein
VRELSRDVSGEAVGVRNAVSCMRCIARRCDGGRGWRVGTSDAFDVGMNLHNVLLALAVTGCATTPMPEPKGGPRGLRATEHVEAARDQDELAKQSSTWPESRAMAPAGSMHTIAFAWTPSGHTPGEHEQLAAAHRGKAADLEADYQEACGARSHADVAVSPLVRYGVGGWPTSTGVIVYLSRDAGPADKVLADLTCHRAWMMLAPADMDDCPLDLPGLVVDARADETGVTLSIVVRDPKLVDELHRRVAHDLETK